MVKKISILVIIVLVFLLNITTIKASITISHECADYRCEEGTDITYSIRIRNNIEKEIDVNYIKVKDELDKNIAIDDEAKYRLLSGESNVFNITDKVPVPPLGGYTLNYYACFGVSVFYPDGTTAVNEVCGDVRKSLTVLPLSKIQCDQNSDCKSDEFCDRKFFKCRAIDCNGFVFNHTCINYFTTLIFLIVLVTIISAVIILKKKRSKREKKSRKKKKKS